MLKMLKNIVKTCFSCFFNKKLIRGHEFTHFFTPKHEKHVFLYFKHKKHVFHNFLCVNCVYKVVF